MKQVSIRSSGVYRCEVSGEAPYFHSAHSEARMEVVYIPKDNPTISGPERQHQVGDNIALNCTSGKSHPASKLQWFINDQLVSDPAFLVEHPHQKHAHGLYTTVLGLRLVIRPQHFREGSMVLRCVATVSTELWRSHTEVVHDDEPPHNVRMLENREAFFELVALTSFMCLLKTDDFNALSVHIWSLFIVYTVLFVYCGFAVNLCCDFDVTHKPINCLVALFSLTYIRQ
ncbi:hypothetical protein FOCC_FOCC011481 [Frankliniella occidentalis]|nr:hypothetical protein FOCC_FOCC011481 [Frankliniella occidentalis]